MGPTRTADTTQQEGGQSSNQQTKPKSKGKKKYSQQDPSGLPGIQKIKSSLRQTRRLLAKDNLAADVRVGTERRLKTLEAELAQAEVAKTERNMAVRYHKVKFFERRKVSRKLAQVKKRLASVDKLAKTKLEASLLDLRVNLNYILHYPKTKKYISLFPPELREGAPEEEGIKVNPESEEVRSWIRTQMAAGELPAEPELHLDSREWNRPSSSADAWESKTPKAKSGLKNQGPSTALEEDSFFGGGEDEDEDEEGE